MDVEEFVRRRIARGEDVSSVREDLVSLIKEYKPGVQSSYAREFSDAVIEEVRNTTGLSGDLFSFSPAGVKMGEFGVGSRGTGDFFAHRQIARIIGKTGAVVGVDEMDDAGVVPLARVPGEVPGKEQGNARYVVCTVDGMHSRLSDFPFLAGFHATRATLRDAYVMGARPIMLFSDIHVADDGDVAKIFDYTAGITTVGEAMGVPLVSGSTLRIGGDMVLGNRMTGCVGTVGIAGHLTARRGTAPGDVLLMTEGAGGGTIATAALYSGFPEVVEETINLHFLTACETLLKDPVLHRIHAMTDVTNGGLRGDVHEMAQTAGCRIVVREDRVAGLVQPRVRELLERLSIDYLGVSLDALLIVAPREAAPAISTVISSAGVRIEEIGCVEKGVPEALLETDDGRRDFSPRFREAAYTPVKKVVDRTARDFDEMKNLVEAAALAAIRKKESVLKRITPSGE
ncbi:hydrogenase expression/formation protein [Methanolinea mesophila]|uniref:AIR synthase-related protein n=1 Tax=Methanolinea mesophila TaxID=547055 RepID=UPI001AE45F18|nr:AIR synthase-related protein [Methanolinea mesophila]MBP1928065.1 hydrogenase expression/formation protein [Methanolinea mesophila]